MNHSDSIKNIAAALAEFQADVKDPARNGENPHFRSKYVQLDGLLAAVRPLLAKHGLSVIQSTGGNGQDIAVTTMLMHKSGEWIETDALVLKAVKTDPQGAGSAVTYGRRYGLSAALGVAWDDDDDGNAASAPPKSNAKATTVRKATKADLLEMLKAEMTRLHISREDLQTISAMKFGGKGWQEMTEKEAAQLVKNLGDYAVEMVEAEDKMLMDGIAHEDAGDRI